MRALVVILFVFGTASASDVLRSKWSSFKAAHGKEYSPAKEAVRLKAFESTLQLIEAHNAKFKRGEVSYSVGLNEFADLTEDERRARARSSLDESAFEARLNVSDADLNMPSAPESVDWRRQGMVTPVKSQQDCGSCYAFSALGAVESALLRTTGRTFDLSEQQLVDCTIDAFSKGMNGGCDGGGKVSSMQHVLENGIAHEQEYPYTSGRTETVGYCRKRNSVMPRNLRLTRVRRNDENALANALALHGPIAVSMNADLKDFQSYTGGIYDNPACPSDRNGHAVLLVGYGSVNGQAFWIVKNSWGSRWGENGYFRLERGTNRCGIVLQDAYPLQATQ